MEPLPLEALACLPPLPSGSLRKQIFERQRKSGFKIVVLDDDPTGTQTVHDANVLIRWDEESLGREFANPESILYLLTNSRSLAPAEAEKLAYRTGRLIRKVESAVGRPALVISRSDSTLRGHYPIEVKSLAQALGKPKAVQVLIPAFIEGGRYTIDDIHYVREGDFLVPAGQTEFAADATFGYRSSNLIDWVVEKYSGRISREAVQTISIALLRKRGPKGVTEFLLGADAGSVVIVNASCNDDLEIFALGYLQAIEQRPEFILRTAASMVPALAGLPPKALLSVNQVGNLTAKGRGGLIVVGSYVKKATDQLNRLLDQFGDGGFCLEVDSLLDPEKKVPYLKSIAEKIDRRLGNDQLAIVYTSRKLRKGSNSQSSLEIGRMVADGLNSLAGQVRTRPRFIIAKGGITSSEIAGHSCGAAQARIMGQIEVGVPFWILRDGSKFPQLPYVVFPGNVGDNDALLNVLRKMNP